MRFDKWEPVRDNSIPAPTSAIVLFLSLSQEAAMPDAKVGEPKKTVERKIYLQVVNVLKNLLELRLLPSIFKT